MQSVSGTLTAVPPFDFTQSLKFLGAFAPAMGDLTVRKQVMTRAARLKGQTIGYQIAAVGSIEELRLDYTLFCENEISPELRAAAETHIANWLSLNDDLKPFYALAKGDAVFEGIIQ